MKAWCGVRGMQATSQRALAGNSLAAELVRASTWSTHSLGPIESWPATLRAALTACFAARSPMQVWWGEQLVVFYNDACIAGLAERHPSVLGRHAPELFGERWSTIRDAVERVRADAIEVEVDGLHLVPIFGDHGVDGILCALPEEPEPEDALEAPSDRRAKHDFLSLIGHELRNPLSALSTTMQVFELRGSSPELALMSRSVRHLSRLVDDLLDISRIARGKLVLHRTRIELAAILDRAMEIVTPLVDDRGTKVFVRVARTGIPIDADGERLARTFAAILTNAIEHSDRGAPIVVEAIAEGQKVRVVVKDEGAGIAPDQLAHVFEAFHTDRMTGGLGLGLAISRGIVELHGGTITIRSAGAGTGSECVVELTRAEKADLGTPRIPVATTVRKRVLLVEDNDDTARALKNALEQLGYKVALAHDGPVALNVARTFEPDVVLLDIGLPVMDGWELARRLRERTSELHFVAVTARDQESDKQTSVAAGFAEHLIKPIDLGRLQNLVEGLPMRTRT
ncbi:MAG: response regulator [Kofleriaceae bacterium]|nr:response regulator [Kofleriaceae bacterium]